MGAYLGVAAGPAKNKPYRHWSMDSEALEIAEAIENLRSTRDPGPLRDQAWSKAGDDYRALFRSNAGKDEATQGTTEVTGDRSGVSTTGARPPAPTGTTRGATAPGATGTTAPGIVPTTTPAVVTPAKEVAATDTEDDYENYSQCGLEDDADEWEEAVGPVRIRSCQLSAEQQKRFRTLLDQILSKEVGLLGERLVFDADDVISVLDAVHPLLESEPVLIEDLPVGITVVADLHGQLFDLYRIFEGDAKDGKLGWEHKKYLFLGNYVDKGRQQLELVMALFIMKMLRPDDIFLLRGNHEFLNVNLDFGFAKMINEYYEEEDAEYLYFAINWTFCHLSIAAIVGNDYFCVHGGISPSFFTRRNMRGIYKPIETSTADPIVHDCVWSEPAEGLVGSCFNGKRQGSIYFGLDALAMAQTTMEVKVVIRGHTRLTHGYQCLWNCLYSIFSATDAGLSKNAGAVIDIDQKGRVTVRELPYCPQRRIWEDKWRALEGAEASTGAPKTECPHEELGNGSLMAM